MSAFDEPPDYVFSVTFAHPRLLGGRLWMLRWATA
jgi:hypothetical protein